MSKFITSRASSSALEEALQRYLVHLQLERGASPRTVMSYESDLTHAVGFLISQGIKSPAQMTHAVLSSYLARLATQKVRTGRPSSKDSAETKKKMQPLRVASASRKITALRTFLRFLSAEGLIAEDFAERISAPRLKRKLPHTLTLQQVEKLLVAIPADTPAGLRDRALVELMFSSGLRVSELCALRITDLAEGDGFLRILGKGSKERLVPVGSSALAALKVYLDTARVTFVRTSKTSSQVFLSSRGTAISRITVWLLLKNYARRAGIPPAMVKPHGLRHSFATELLKGGADLRLIQGLLGHSSIATTQIYTAVEPTQLLESHALYHPRSGMKG